MHITRNFILRTLTKVKWQRNLSNFAMKVDDFTIKSSLPYQPTPHVRLFDRMWVNSSVFEDKVALVSAETNKSYTYLQLQKYISVFATSLLTKLGLQSEDKVAIGLPNCPEFPVVAFGALQAGCVATTINPAYKSYELIHHLTMTKPKVFVTTSAAYDTIVAALKDAKVEAKIVIIDNPSDPVPDGAIRYSEVAESDEVNYSLLDKVNKKHDDLAFLPFSSGTTGLPKGVQITYKNLLGAMEVMSHEKICLPSLSVGSHQDILQCVLPFFHIYGLVILLLGHLSVGCKLITMASFQPQVYLDTLKNEKISLLYAVPPIINMLGKNPTVTKDHFKNLKYVFCGAAPLSAADAEGLLHKLGPKTQFLQGFALTETTAVGTWTYKDTGNTFFGSTGAPILNVELRFADPNTGALVPIGQPGEVMLRSPCIMKGYYQNELATKMCMTTDGFFKTGDLGVYNIDEGLYILDRLKEIIKVKGMQVAPAELESVLRTHPSVLDAGVTGVPHAFFGEVPKAFVVLNKEKPVVEEELKAFVASKVANYKQIHEVVFVDAVPKNPSGKILRKVLREM